MFRKTLMALAAASSPGISAGAALTPAMANDDFCTENPSVRGWPGNFDVRHNEEPGLPGLEAGSPLRIGKHFRPNGASGVGVSDLRLDGSRTHCRPGGSHHSVP